MKNSFNAENLLLACFGLINLSL